MTDDQPCVLCVDDEQNILNSLKRLLRKEDYRLLTASSGARGLEILRENRVHVVISDQRMAEMSGVEFLARVKEEYPDAIRIILTGYTEVDSITEAINKGHIYKFFLKPWNDQNLKLEIRQALDQYLLAQDNKLLHEKIIMQNEELKQVNQNLERMVQERTQELEVRNRALELSRAILEDIPVPIIGISADGMIVFINRKVQKLSNSGTQVKLGNTVRDYFPAEVIEAVDEVLTSELQKSIEGCAVSGSCFNMELIPLSGRFRGKGVILAMKEQG